MKLLHSLVASLSVASLVACGSSAPSTSKPLSGVSVDNGAGTLAVLTIEIRKGIIIQGEFATVIGPTGAVLAQMPCKSSVAVDFINTSCTTDGYDLEVGRIVVRPAPSGLLTANGATYNVSCTKVAPRPNGVDGPVLEYKCHAQARASGPGA